jgi:transcriptional repressor NrdR
LRCPFCKKDKDRVVDSRSSDAGRTIRRRRLCLVCKRRCTTYERTVDGFKLFVVKKDKSRVPYDREKIVAGLEKACYKRPVSAEQIQQIADRTEESLFRHYDKEVSSSVIGDLLMKHLRAVDKIAFIRFASVCRDFKSASELLEDVTRTLQQAEPTDQLRLFEE